VIAEQTGGADSRKAASFYRTAASRVNARCDADGSDSKATALAAALVAAD
jgi:hypothetical protein